MSKIPRNDLATVTVKDRYPLSKEGSSKQTWHVTLDLQGADIDFHPGDSVGIYAQNDPELVNHLINAMGASPSDLVIAKKTGDLMTLEEFLSFHANLSRITSSFLKLIHETSPCSTIESVLSDKEKMRTFLAENDPLFLLRDYANAKLPLQTLCDQFGPMLPRFYSVASSLKTQRDTLDLTVALFTWMQGDEKRYGVASHFLCHLAEVDKTPIPLYVQPANHFRLPTDHSKDIIMVGPGTGVAPFRAFMQERKYFGAEGRNWLFFGERNARSDFFYEEEWKEHKDLRLHTAFSRDQLDKIYVQHKIEECADELYEWLENGAHLYVCGDAKQMARDVDEILRKILSDKKKISLAEAKDHLKLLKKTGRYLLDVY